MARDGAPEFTIVVAGEQVEGRGRRGRAWESPAGNLYTSTILRPACSVAKAAQIGFVAALSLAEALDTFGLNARLKWPNDVLVAGGKVAGILPESEGQGDRVAWIVLGLGINIAAAPAGTPFPASSLRGAGCAATRDDVLGAYTEVFRRRYRTWTGAGFAALRADWLSRAENLGGEIEVRLHDRTVTGRFADLDPDGTLLLDRNGDGRVRVTAGEIFALGT